MNNCVLYYICIILDIVLYFNSVQFDFKIHYMQKAIKYIQ